METWKRTIDIAKADFEMMFIELQEELNNGKNHAT